MDAAIRPPDATPPPGEWTDWFLSEIAEREAFIDRLRNEVSRRDAVLDWITDNAPQTLVLCPYKLRREP